MTKFFKGWAKPGPEAPGATQSDHPDLQPRDCETLDALSGEFRIFQLSGGHRFSTDDLLAAWYGTTWCPSAARVLDLGSGIGSVGMIAAWRLQGARFVTVEAQDISVVLAKRSASFNGLNDRYDIRHGDFRDPGVLAPEDKFDLILGSPPYFALTDGVLGDHPQKIACRFETRGTVAAYCEVAARHLNSGGVFACVFPVSPDTQRERVVSAARDAGLKIVRSRDVCLREGDVPLLGLFAMTRADHLPPSFQTWTEPVLTIRTRTGAVHPEYQAVKLAIGFPP